MFVYAHDNLIIRESGLYFNVKDIILYCKDMTSKVEDHNM